ncbi:MAG: YraN family protein [Desulfobacteraceae bacterium]|jgi:putative endonuclease
MPSLSQRKGQRSESLALRYLTLKGYTIIAQNHRSRLGEIDIIAKEKDTIVFVEVKARSTERFGTPKLAVTQQKQKKLSRLALEYLKNHGKSYAKARFDVVAIVQHNSGMPEIELIKNAFNLAY